MIKSWKKPCPDETVMEVKYNDDKKLEEALPYFESSFSLFKTAVSPPDVVIKTLGDI